VTKGIVDLLESVHIQHENGQACLMAFGGLDGDIEPVLKQTAVASPVNASWSAMWRNRSSLLRRRLVCSSTRLRSASTQASTSSIPASTRASKNQRMPRCPPGGALDDGHIRGERMSTRKDSGTAIPAPTTLLFSRTEQTPVIRNLLPIFQALISESARFLGRIAVKRFLPEVSRRVVSKRPDRNQSLTVNLDQFRVVLAEQSLLGGYGISCKWLAAGPFAEHFIHEDGRVIIGSRESNHVYNVALIEMSVLTGLRADPAGCIADAEQRAGPLEGYYPAQMHAVKRSMDLAPAQQIVNKDELAAEKDRQALLPQLYRG